MTPFEIGGYAIAALLLLILIGMPIGICMLTVSFIGVALIRGDMVAIRMIGAAANDSMREYLFTVMPLFVLMGLLVTVSGVGKDTFDVFERLLKRVTAGLGIATVFANTVVAGSSVLGMLIPPSLLMIVDDCPCRAGRRIRWPDVSGRCRPRAAVGRAVLRHHHPAGPHP